MFKLLVVAGLALSALGTAQGETRTLSGTLQNWNLGAATIETVAAYNLTGDAPFTLATGEVAEDGSFTLELPAEVPRDFLYEGSFDCPSGGLTVTPATVQMFSIDTLNLLQNGEKVGTASLASSQSVADLYTSEKTGSEPTGSVAEGDSLLIPSYFSAALSAQGSCLDEAATPSRTDMDIEAQPGWTYVMITVTAVSPEGVATGVKHRTVVEVPDSLNWYFVRASDEPGGSN